MRLRDVIDQFHHDNRLADPGAAEQSDFAAAQKRLNQIDDLDSGLEHLQFRGLFVKRRRMTVNRIALLMRDIAEVVDGFADNIHDAAERTFAHRHGNRTTGIDGVHAADHTISRQHRHRAHAAFPEVLLYFGDDIDGIGHLKAVGSYAQSLVNRRQVVFSELDVDYRADDLHNFADVPVSTVTVGRSHICLINSSNLVPNY